MRAHIEPEEASADMWEALSNAQTRPTRTAASVRRGDPEAERGTALPWHIIVEDRAGALVTASEWCHQDTVWTDGSRLDSNSVGAACVWKTPTGWTGQRYHLGTNKRRLTQRSRVCSLQSPQYHRPAPGERPPLHGLLGLHGGHRQDQGICPRACTALCGRGLRGLYPDPQPG